MHLRLCLRDYSLTLEIIWQCQWSDCMLWAKYTGASTKHDKARTGWLFLEMYLIITELSGTKEYVDRHTGDALWVWVLWILSDAQFAERYHLSLCGFLEIAGSYILLLGSGCNMIYANWHLRCGVSNYFCFGTMKYIYHFTEMNTWYIMCFYNNFSTYSKFIDIWVVYPDSKFHGANMWPI